VGDVQFFDLVEVDWKSERGHVATVAAGSGYTVGAIAGTCTAGRGVGLRAGAGRPERRDGAIAPAMRDDRTTAITSARCGPADGSRQWGIMVPES